MWRFRSSRGSLLLAAILPATLATLGCQRAAPPLPTTHVTGQVVHHGQPVSSGGVSFGPQGKGRSVWAPLKDGRYAADVPTGKTLVQLNATEEAGSTTSEFGKPVTQRQNLVPDLYRQGVIVDIGGDTLELDFDLSRPTPTPPTSSSR